MKKLYLAFVFAFVLMNIGLVSASLGDQLIMYYDFEDSTEEINRIFNLSDHEGSPTFTTTNALIGKSGSLSANNNFNITSGSGFDIPKIKNNTIVLWFRAAKADQPSETYPIYMTANTGSPRLDYFQADGDSRFVDLGDISLDPPGFVPDNTWTMFAIVANQTNVTMYENGVQVAKANYKGTLTRTIDIVIGSNTAGSLDMVGLVDEYGFWNRSLTSKEIMQIYNNGSGVTFTNDLFPVLNAPITSAELISTHLLFNSTTLNLRTNNALVNSTLNIWYSNGSLFNQTTNLITGNNTIETTWNVTGFDLNNFRWNAFSCATNKSSRSNCFWANTNDTFTWGISDINQQLKNTVFETATDQFNISFNVSSGTPTAFLWWNGTKTTGTATNTGGNSWFFSRAFNIIPSPTEELGLKNVFWEIIIGSSTFNSTAKTQTTAQVNLTLCGGSPQNIPYLNFTYRNETASLEEVNASVSASTFVYFIGDGGANKTFLYSNSTEKRMETFCFTPSNQSVNAKVSYLYENVYSPVRTFTTASILLSSVVTQQQLQLLPLSLGIFTRYQTISTSGNVIKDVLGVVKRTLGGTSTIVSSGFTDDSGLVVFFLNPDFAYDYTFSKSGFSDNTFSLTPNSIDTFTVTMGGSESGQIGNGTSVGRNLTYALFPSNSSLSNNTDFTFALHVNGTGISFASLNLTNSSGQQIFFSSRASEGIVTTTLNTGNQTNIYAFVTITNNGETVTFNHVWIIGDIFIGEYSLFKQMSLFIDLGFALWIRLLIVILITTGLVVFLSHNEVLDTSESKIWVVALTIWAFSLVGWLSIGLPTGSGGNTTVLSSLADQYGIAILTTASAFIFTFRRLIR